MGVSVTGASEVLEPSFSFHLGKHQVANVMYASARRGFPGREAQSGGHRQHPKSPARSGQSRSIEPSADCSGQSWKLPGGLVRLKSLRLQDKGGMFHLDIWARVHPSPAES